MVSNEHKAARSCTEDLILKGFIKQTYGVTFKAPPTIIVYSLLSTFVSHIFKCTDNVFI